MFVLHFGTCRSMHFSTCRSIPFLRTGKRLFSPCKSSSSSLQSLPKFSFSSDYSSKSSSSSSSSSSSTSSSSSSSSNSKSYTKFSWKLFFQTYVAGFAAGGAGSCLGIGGGLLLIPLLVGPKFGHLSQLHANGTVQFANVSTAVAGAASFAYDGCVMLSVALVCGASATVMTGIGVRIASAVSETVLKRTFALGLMGMAPIVSLKPYLTGMSADGGGDSPPNAAAPLSGAGGAEVAANQTTNDQTTSPVSTLSTAPSTPTKSTIADVNHPSHSDCNRWNSLSVRQIPFFALLGGGVGLASGMAGFGAGTLLTSALAVGADDVLYPGHRITQQVAIGTSMAALAVPNAVGAATHLALGNVHRALVPGLVLGTASGAVAGSRLALDTNETWLRASFSAVLFSVGFRSLLKTVR